MDNATGKSRGQYDNFIIDKDLFGKLVSKFDYDSPWNTSANFIKGWQIDTAVMQLEYGVVISGSVENEMKKQDTSNNGKQRNIDDAGNIEGVCFTKDTHILTRDGYKKLKTYRLVMRYIPKTRILMKKALKK